MNDLVQLLRGLGVLRGLLFAVVVALVIMGPFSGGPVSIEGWRLFSSVVAPAFYVIVLFVVPLDMVMTAVFRASAPDTDLAQRRRYGRILILEGILYITLLASWAPFVAKLLRLTS